MKQRLSLSTMKQRLIILGLGLFCAALWLPSQAEADSYPKSLSLRGNLKVTERESNKSKNTLTQCKSHVDRAHSALEYSRKIADSLQRIDNILKTTIAVSGPLQALPKVGPVVRQVNQAAQRMRRKMAPIKSKVDAFEQKAKPARGKLATLSKHLQTGINGYGTIHDTAGKTRVCNASAQQGITALPSSGTKQNLHRGLESLSGQANPPVSQLNQWMVRSNQTVARVQRAFDPLMYLEKPALSVGRGLDKLMRVLGPLERQFGHLNKVLNQRISVPYAVRVRKRIKVKRLKRVPRKIYQRVKKYRDVIVNKKERNCFKTRKVWKWITKCTYKWVKRRVRKAYWVTTAKTIYETKEVVEYVTKTFVETKKFSFTVRQILNGVNTGIGVVNKKLEYLAHKALGPVMEHLKIPLPDVPGLSSLQGALARAMSSLNQVQRKADVIAQALQQLQSRAQTLASALGACYNYSGRVRHANNTRGSKPRS